MFEAYLVREGLISADDLVAALEHQFRSRPPIGRIAVTSGMITMKQAFHLVGLQSTAHRRFGELAIELGYLTSTDLNDLLASQSRLQKSLSEVLVEMGAIGEEMLRTAQARYYNESDRTIDQVAKPVLEPAFYG